MKILVLIGASILAAVVIWVVYKLYHIDDDFDDLGGW
jgi:hypothetical protein